MRTLDFLPPSSVNCEGNVDKCTPTLKDQLTGRSPSIETVTLHVAFPVAFEDTICEYERQFEVTISGCDVQRALSASVCCEQCTQSGLIAD